MFGGIDEHNQVSDTLWLMQVLFPGNRLLWNRVETAGKGPNSWFGHTMDYYEKRNILILFGGWDESIGTKGKIYNDLFFLEIESLIWKEVKFLSKPPKAWFSHSMCVLGQRIIVFGGMGDKFRIENSIDLFLLDSEECF